MNARATHITGDGVDWLEGERLSDPKYEFEAHGADRYWYQAVQLLRFEREAYDMPLFKLGESSTPLQRMREYKDIVSKSDDSDNVDVTLLFIAVVKTEMESRKCYARQNAYVQTQPDKKLVNDETMRTMMQKKDKRDDNNKQLGSTKGALGPGAEWFNLCDHVPQRSLVDAIENKLRDFSNIEVISSWRNRDALFDERLKGYVPNEQWFINAQAEKRLVLRFFADDNHAWFGVLGDTVKATQTVRKSVTKYEILPDTACTGVTASEVAGTLYLDSTGRELDDANARVQAAFPPGAAANNNHNATVEPTQVQLQCIEYPEDRNTYTITDLASSKFTSALHTAAMQTCKYLEHLSTDADAGRDVAGERDAREERDARARRRAHANDIGFMLLQWRTDTL